MIEVVADTNILFSALATRGRIRELILTRPDLILHAPVEAGEELYRHTDKLSSYLSLPLHGIKWVINLFLRDVVVLHAREEYKGKLAKALSIVEDTDPADAPFIALAMHLGVPLWTGDKGILSLAVETGFRFFKAVDTRGVEMLLEGREWAEVRGYLAGRYGGEL